MIDIDLLKRLAQHIDAATYRRFLNELPAGIRDELLGCLPLEDAHSITTSLAETKTADQRHTPAPSVGESIPTQIGRYRVLRVLGKGGFGSVYLAADDQLERTVAIKVPNPEGVSDAGVELYLREAKILAQLEHPNIVPVYDVFESEYHPCVIVSKFIGSDLRQRLLAVPFSHNEAAQLVATVASALHHAHKQGLVHRDIKPSNILVDELGNPHVADFGLAHMEVDWSNEQVRSGTPRYMSPEQASGRGAMVDGRSDIFSLGAVLYEMLVGKPPFEGSTSSDVVARIVSGEAKPPRQIDDKIPQELERICLKALSKDLGQRYTTAMDFSDDLRNATTYSPKPLDVSHIGLSHDLRDLVELLAQNCHDVWARQRVADGWEYGSVRDDQLKRHPDLVPYTSLPESEKAYDRILVEGILKAVLAMGFQIEKTEPPASGTD